jgi:tetratricopeptide (TPR) repeat protein
LQGKRCFVLAKQVAGLEVSMAAAMGKRTKHQHSEYAQLFLFAKSGLLGGDDAPPLPAPAPKKAESVGQILPPRPPTEEEEEGEKNPDAWQHSEWEMGRRMVRENASGEEVAVREVLLDSMDGGAVENIVLEGGPKFSSAELDKGGVLHPIDQAIVLALCLDVSNSNPVDGLTNEEMQPYVERVLGLATNWMIHSTALLERSWLEFERRKTMDRAMLQIQALIDQHTTKLTVMQSTYKSIEESAPVEDRMRYLYSIVYPAQYELKRDLATRYLRCQVFMSALNYFRELEMWDEVVTCYQLMEKPHRAELVVREQLAKAGETPYMLTSLADLTRKEEYYDRAWEISKGRFPRAKRTLGKICYDRGDFEACITHLDLALSVHPLVATAWYLKGLACMRLERWDEAIESFVRCVQQDMEIGEAWANIGAINMRLRQWPKAFEALTEALRHKQDSWRIVENLMTVALAMGRWKDTTRFMQRLLDLRMKSQRPIHKDELRHLCYITSSQGQREARARAKAAAAHTASAAWSTSDASAPTAADDLSDFEPAASAPPPPTSEAVLAALASLREVLEEDPDFDADDIDTVLEVAPQPGDTILAVDKLLTNITVAVPSDAEVWDVYADFQHTLGRFRLELDCRTKQV